MWSWTKHKSYVNASPFPFVDRFHETGNERITLLHGAFAKPFFPWKSSKYYLFWACAHTCARVCVRTLSCPSRKVHSPYCIIIWSLSDSIIFFHIIINSTIFGKTLLNIKRVFWFSLQLLSETVLILRGIQRDIINIHMFPSKVHAILVRF
jgi:hypothetical protein